LIINSDQYQALPISHKKLIRRRDSKSELSLRRHSTRTTKYNMIA